MRVNELLINVCGSLNIEVDKLMEITDYSDIIGNIISDEITDTNYKDLVDTYLDGINKLKMEGLTVKFNLKNILLVLKTLKNVEIEDFDILVNYNPCSVKEEVLNELYLDNVNIKNIYLKESKNIIISTTYSQFEEYIVQLRDQSENISDIFYILKALYDNIEYQKEEDMNRIIFLSNCNASDIEIYKQNHNELVSYLKLCILSDGKSFHKHHELNGSFSVVPPCASDKKYYQYNEILFILSEYNNSSDILNKYFLLYTIIENFMYRYPISYMTRNMDDFSIRDFKYFYSKIDTNELSKLKDLFDKFMNIEMSDIKISDYLNTELANFESSFDNNLVELVIFLKKIRVYNKNFEINKNILKGSFTSKYFCEIIYQLRNSILHNTATEFHITHYMLEKHTIIFDFLKSFIIPILEKIILHMIYWNDETITYADNKLLLYNA